MAKVSIQLPNQFMDQLAKIAAKTDTAIPKALEAGGKVVFEKMQANLHAAIGRGTKYKSRSTGKLLGALGVSPVKVNDEAITTSRSVLMKIAATPVTPCSLIYLSTASTVNRQSRF